MPGLRRALLFASGGRYLVMAVNLVAGVILARLLTPAEFGISVLGASLLGMAEAIRELGSIAYIVQQKELTQEKIRTVFTVSLIVTLSMAFVLVLLSGTFARFYGLPGLGAYIRIVALSYAIAPFAHPIYALLSREMAFGTLAFLDVLTTLVSGLASVVFVLLGARYLGLAWASVLSAAVWTLLGICVRRDLSVYRPSLAAWRSVLAFGGYGSATAVLYKATESVSYLILGKILGSRSVGLCQRSLMLAQFPERVVLAGIGSVALPAFSGEARRGRPLRYAYLSALEHATAIQWPVLILLSVLAQPLVSLLLGPQWHDAIPLVQIFAVALMFNFPTAFNYPIQVAAGAIRWTVPLAFVQTAVSLIILTLAAPHGIRVVALSGFVTIPINVALSVLVVRAHIHFRGRDLAAALCRSAGVAALSMAGPLLSLLLPMSGHPAARIALVAALGATGWLAGLWLTRHPLFDELGHAFGKARRFAASQP